MWPVLELRPSIGQVIVVTSILSIRFAATVTLFADGRTID